MIVITELQYFPPVTLFKEVIENLNVKFDIYDDHRKMSFRNRCVLAGGSGPVNLSIPLVEGRNQKRPTKEVRIDNKTGWQGQHWKTITSCYNRSPWFEFYGHELEELYRQRMDWLVDWNRACWNWVVEKLGADIETSYSDGPLEFQELKQDGIPKPREIAKTVEVTGLEPVSKTGPGSAFQYLDLRNKLLPRTIDQLFPEPVRYRQVFEDRTGFIPHLSILDLLFCEGKRSVEILKYSKIPN